MSNPADQLLKKLGISFEDLDKPGHMGEKEAYFELLRQTEQAPLSVDSIRLNVMRAKYAVEMELTDPKRNKSNDEFLLARLRNYLLLEGVLFSPQNAVEVYRKDLQDLLGKK